MTVANPRILLVGDSLALGGTEGQFTEIAVGLSRSRWDVDVSCLRAEGPLRTKLESAGVRAWSCGRGSLKSPRLLLAVSALARYPRTHRVRLVHAFDFYSNILGVLAARIARVPVVIASQRDLGDLRSPFQRRVHQSVLRLADYILVNSEAVAERIEPNRAAGRGRIVVIPNGVDAARFSPGGRRRPPPGAVTVGTLANLRPEKGLSDFMRAAALVRERCDARFVVWGDGPLRSDLEHLLRALGLDGKIELRGRSTEPEARTPGARHLRADLAQRSMLERPYRSHGDGAAGGRDSVGGNPELVEDEVTGVLTPPADPAGLAKAILRLIEQPAVVERLGAARASGRERSSASSACSTGSSFATSRP